MYNTPVMAKDRTITIRCSSEQEQQWTQRAEREERAMSDWVRRVLDCVANSNVTVMELRDLLNKATEGKTKG